MRENITPLEGSHGRADELESHSWVSERRLMCGGCPLIREQLQGQKTSRSLEMAAVGQSRDSLHCIAVQHDADTEHWQHHCAIEVSSLLGTWSILACGRNSEWPAAG